MRPYLSYLTEAVLSDSKNKGSLRKNIWLYLMKKYENDVDYQEFLIAIRKFMNDGKMFNREGELSMHPEVILEVKDKATPVKYARKGPSSMIGDEAFKGSKLGGDTSVKPGAYSQAKASVSGGKK